MGNNWWVSILIIFVLTLGGCWMLGDLLVNSDAPETSTPSIGQEGLLYVKGIDDIPVAISETSYDSTINSLTANDMVGLTELVISERVFLVKNGIRVLVIDSDFGKRKIRILNGEQINRAGWVPSEWIEK